MCNVALLLEHYLNIYLFSFKINAHVFYSTSRTKIALKLQHGFNYFVTISPQVHKNNQIYSESKTVLIPEKLNSHTFTHCKEAHLKTNREVLTWGQDALFDFQQNFSVPIPVG